MKTRSPLSRLIRSHRNALLLLALAGSAVGQVSLTQAERLLPENQVRIQGGGWFDHATIWPATGNIAGPLLTTIGPAERGVGAAEMQASVTFDAASIDSFHPDRSEIRFSMNALDGTSLELIFFHCDFRSGDDWTWYGKIAGIAVSEVILSRKDTSFAMIARDHASPRTWLLQPEAHDVHRLRLLKAGAPGGSCGTTGPMSPSEVAAETWSAPTADFGGGDLPPDDPADTVDVMFVFTTEAAALGTNAMRAFSATMVADFNTRASNSTLNLQLRISDVIDSQGYSESSDGSVDLSRISNGSDGILDWVQPERNKKRADLVALIRFSPWGGSCGSGSTVGVAWRPDSLTNSPTAGFSVTSLCGDWPHTFSHELGHNFGACHDAAQGGCTSSITASPRGKVVQCNVIVGCESWRTTMAYDPGCSLGNESLPYFSRVNLSVDTGFPCGVYDLWDSVSQVQGLIATSQYTVAQNQLATSQIWAILGASNTPNGTFYRPYPTVLSATNVVLGGADDGVVRVAAGTYNETASNGGNPIVISSGCTIMPDGGVVTLR